MKWQPEKMSRRTLLSTLGTGIGAATGGRFSRAVDRFGARNTGTSAAPDDEVTIFEDVVHLGDGRYGGTINSRFETSSEQTTYQTTFRLSAAQADANQARLTFMARGVQRDNPIDINGSRVGVTPMSPDNGYADGEQVSVRTSVLEEGTNTFSVGAYYDGTDYDDFEIFDVQLQLWGVQREPEAAFDVAQREPVVGLEATFDASASTDPDGEIASYEWDLDGDGSVDATGEEATHIFEAPGTHEVSLRVTDGDGLQSTTTETVRAVEVTASLEDPRLVQTVEESFVTAPDVDRVVDAPDMVAGRPTSVVFGLDGENLDVLPEEATPELRVSVGDLEEDVDLSPETVSDLAERPAGAAGEAFADAAGRPPVFELPEDASVTAELSSPAFADDPSVELSAGDDFAVAAGQSLKIGVIEVQDAVTDDDGERRFGDPRNDGRIIPSEFDDARTRFEAICDAIEAYVLRTFPVTDVEVVRPEAPGTYAAYASSGNYEQDLLGADAALRASVDDLDATVAITPFNYFQFHDKKAAGIEIVTTGAEIDADLDVVERKWEQPPTATASIAYVGVNEQTGPALTAATVAQEIGHHFAGFDAYPPALARQEGWLDNDTSHARTEDDSDGDEHALRSRCYDLFDGEFTYLREGGTEGFWASDRATPTQDGTPTLNSFMSYAGDDKWADAHFYQQRIDGSLEATPPLSREPGSGQCLVASADVTDDGVDVQDVVETTGEVTTETEGDVSVAVEDANGNELAARTAHDTTVVLGHGGGVSVREGRTTFAVPYPENAAQVRVRHEEKDVEATVDPVSETLKGAIRQVPDRGFSGDVDTQREGLLATATRFETSMADGNHGEAKSALNDLETDVESWLRDDYATAANQYNKAELLALIDDQRTRVDAIATDADSGFSSTDLGVLGAAGVAGAGSLGYVLYRYGHYRESSTDDGPTSNVNKRGSVKTPENMGGVGQSGRSGQSASSEQGGQEQVGKEAVAGAGGGSVDDAGPAFCPNCGTEIEGDWQFCMECGETLSIRSD